MCGSLCDPSLSLSQEEEEEEKVKAKKTIQLLKVAAHTLCACTCVYFDPCLQVLATITPTNFSSKEVCEQLVSLIRNEDMDIGSGKACLLFLLFHCGICFLQLLPHCRFSL